MLTATVVLATVSRSTPAAPKEEQRPTPSTSPVRNSSQPRSADPALGQLFATAAVGHIPGPCSPGRSHTAPGYASAC